MEDSAQRALARLRQPDGSALRALAQLMVDQTSATPLRDIARPEWLATQLATALEAASRGDALRAWTEELWQRQREQWAASPRPLREALPADALPPIREILGRPWSPSESVTLRLLDQRMVRGLIRQVLGQTVQNFRNRLHLFDGSAVQGLGERASRRAQGLFQGVRSPLGAREKLGNLGSLAENLVGIVRDEVEQGVEARVKEFVEGATQDALRSMAKAVADPKQAQAWAELRLGTLDVVLDLPLSEWVSEADRLEPQAWLKVVQRAVQAEVGRPDFVAAAASRIGQALDQVGEGTLQAWLEEVGLATVWRETTTELLTERLQSVVQTEAFSGWWADLFR
jgi:hypothetical protein